MKGILPLLLGSLLALPFLARPDDAPAEAAVKRPEAIRVLSVGGGSAHDFDRWFNRADTATLSEGGLARVHYTEDPARILPALKESDVLLLSLNQPIPDEATRRAIFRHVEAGGGLVLVHAGLWYNWPDWPEFNRRLAGGGSRGHDRLGDFTVRCKGVEHPLLEGLPKEFRLRDELYYFQPDPEGASIEVLATAHSRQRDQTFPIVFTVEHPKARIASITLGHDGDAHGHAAYKRLLRNAVRWTARQ